MANSGVSGAIRTPVAGSAGTVRAPVEHEDIDASVERQHQRGLRTVDHEARGALRRAGLEEGREHIVTARRIEKMVPTEILLSRLADPSSGSMATQSGASGSRISGSASSSDRIAATGAARRARRIIASAATIDILLPITVGIDAAVLSGDAGQRPIGDQRGKLDRGGRRSHRSPRRPPRHEASAPPIDRDANAG